jgi:hypothetical protein
MSSDTFLGFLLQSAIISSSAGFRHDFEQRVKLAIQQDPKLACPTFDSLLIFFQHLQPTTSSTFPTTRGTTLPTLQ